MRRKQLNKIYKSHCDLVFYWNEIVTDQQCGFSVFCTHTIEFYSSIKYQYRKWYNNCVEKGHI